METKEVIEYGLDSLHALRTAWGLNLKYLQDLEIRPDEWRWYFQKSTALALCYVGFAPDSNRGAAEGAGRAAFLSCAYDVATDLRKGLNDVFRDVFESIVNTEASDRLSAMALKLFDDDIGDALKDDALERGAVAFEFIIEMMGVRDFYEGQGVDVYELGCLLQIVDDVLDLEKDVENDDQNCLRTSRRDEHLHRLLHEMDDDRIEELFPRGMFLKKEIRRARAKAALLLMESEV